jgi:hypothetical protein
VTGAAPHGRDRVALAQRWDVAIHYATRDERAVPTSARRRRRRQCDPAIEAGVRSLLAEARTGGDLRRQQCLAFE